jgi:hypothetical protein
MQDMADKDLQAALETSAWAMSETRYGRKDNLSRYILSSVLNRNSAKEYERVFDAVVAASSGPKINEHCLNDC